MLPKTEVFIYSDKKEKGIKARIADVEPGQYLHTLGKKYQSSEYYRVSEVAKVDWHDDLHVLHFKDGSALPTRWRTNLRENNRPP